MKQIKKWKSHCNFFVCYWCKVFKGKGLFCSFYNVQRSPLTRPSIPQEQLTGSSGQQCRAVPGTHLQMWSQANDQNLLEDWPVVLLLVDEGNWSPLRKAIQTLGEICTLHTERSGHAVCKYLHHIMSLSSAQIFSTPGMFS